MQTVAGSIQAGQAPRKGTQEEVRGSAPPETVDLVNGSDLNSICRHEICQAVIPDLKDQDTHQSPVALSVDLFPLYFHPSSAIYQVTKYIYECLLYITSAPITGSVSHPNGGGDFCVFLSFRVISACCSSQDAIEFTRGVLNWSVALSSASVRVNPHDEKSVQVSVVRFPARDCHILPLT